MTHIDTQGKAFSHSPEKKKNAENKWDLSKSPSSPALLVLLVLIVLFL